MEERRVRMVGFCVLWYALLTGYVGAVRDGGSGACIDPCTISTAGFCCVGGEPFAAVELETRTGILSGNDVVWRIEQEMLRYSLTQQQQMSNSLQRKFPNSPQQLEVLAVPAELAETVHLMAARALHWLCELKLRLARFSTHEVVGASAKPLYNILRQQFVLLMSLAVWSADEIAGIHSLPPTIDGYGPCGGRWPCQQPVTCPGEGCKGGFPRQPMQLFFKPQPIPRSQPQYSEYNPYLPRVQTPPPVSTVKQMQGTTSGYGDTPNDPVDLEYEIGLDWLQEGNRDQSLPDYFANPFNQHHRKSERKPHDLIESKYHDQANNEGNPDNEEDDVFSKESLIGVPRSFHVKKKNA